MVLDLSQGDNYNRMLRGIQNVCIERKRKPYALLAKFCRNYHLDYRRTLQDFRHVVSEMKKQSC